MRGVRTKCKPIKALVFRQVFFYAFCYAFENFQGMIDALGLQG